MSRVLIFRDQQRVKRLDVRLLRKITLYLLVDLLENETFELGIQLVGADKMASVNETFLQHTGSTDVITFDYSSVPARPDVVPTELHGELFISIDDAIAQAKEFRTTWQGELVRYIVHGVLHLRGFDDLSPGPRKKMKRREGQLVQELSRKFAVAKLERRDGARR